MFCHYRPHADANSQTPGQGVAPTPQTFRTVWPGHLAAQKNTFYRRCRIGKAAADVHIPRALPLTLPAAPERQRRLTPCGCSNRLTATTSGDRSPVLPGFLSQTQTSFERRSIRGFGGFAAERGANRAATVSVHSYSRAQNSPVRFWAFFRELSV